MIASILNLKGGVGKTETCIYMSLILSEMKKVLMVDVDKQANGSTYFINPERLEESNLINYLKTKKKDNIIKINDNLDLLPGTLEMAHFSEYFAGEYGKELIFKSTLKTLFSKYEVVLLDNPPDLGLLNINSVIVSDTIIIPIDTDPRSLLGAETVFKNIIAINKAFSIEMPKVYILPLKIKTRMDKKILKNIIPEQFRDVVILEHIKFYDNLGEIYKTRKIHKKVWNDYKTVIKGIAI